MAADTMRSRRAIVGTSLKAYMDFHQTRAWMETLATRWTANPPHGIDVFAIPDFVSLTQTRAILDGTGIALGAQNVFWEDRGAFTGEVTAPVLAQAGCRYVEIGHAERRALFGETDSIVGRKVAACVRAGMVPVLCLGEAEKGDVGSAVVQCMNQFGHATHGLPPDTEIVVAWEPVWAIGQPEPASAAYIREVGGALGAALATWTGVRIIYGGSAGPGLLGDVGDVVDGLFLGRFAHNIDNFFRVLAEAAAKPPRR